MSTLDAENQFHQQESPVKMKQNKSERPEKKKKRLKQVVVDHKWPMEMDMVERCQVEEDMRGIIQTLQDIEEDVEIISVYLYRYATAKQNLATCPTSNQGPSNGSIDTFCQQFHKAQDHHAEEGRWTEIQDCLQKIKRENTYIECAFQQQVDKFEYQENLPSTSAGLPPMKMDIDFYRNQLSRYKERQVEIKMNMYLENQQRRYSTARQNFATCPTSNPGLSNGSIDTFCQQMLSQMKMTVLNIAKKNAYKKLRE